MKKLKKYIVLALSWALSFLSFLSAQDFEMRGQATMQTSAFLSNDITYLKSGFNYFPEFTLSENLSESYFFDVELSFKATANYFREELDTQFKLYRLKLRLAGEQSELRIGLQKINFGPARLLRSLQWFDGLDPRDPLNLTEGVYALRYKYSFLNNAGIWFWILYGNEKTKGIDLFKTESDTPEFGGRFLYPIFDGEAAATFHSRKVNSVFGIYRENRFALDGRWEIELGLWTEAVLINNRTNLLPYKFQKNITVGTDYTFNIGNGLVATAEHMAILFSNDLTGNDFDVQASALSLNYLLGLIDNLNFISTYSWETEKLSHYLQWQRVFDNFIFSTSLFYYPEIAIDYYSSTPRAMLSGYGFQFMVIYNY